MEGELGDFVNGICFKHLEFFGCFEFERGQASSQAGS